MYPTTTTGLGRDSSSIIMSTPVRLALGIKSPVIAPTVFYTRCQSPPRRGSQFQWTSLWSYPPPTVTIPSSSVWTGSQKWLTSSLRIRVSLRNKRLNSICGTSFDYMGCLRISCLTEANNSSPDLHSASSNSAISRGTDLRRTIPNPTVKRNGRTKPWSSIYGSIATTNKTTGATSSPMPNSCTTTPRTRRPSSLPSSLIRDTTHDISCPCLRPPNLSIPLPNVLLNSSVNSTEYSATIYNTHRPSTKPTKTVM